MSDKHDKKPDTHAGAKAGRPNRFVQDGIEGITIGGLPVEEYLKTPAAQKALADRAAREAAAAQPPGAILPKP